MTKFFIVLFDLFISGNTQFEDQFTNRFDVRDVSCKHLVVERQAAAFPENESQIDLRIELLHKNITIFSILL